MFGYRTQNDDMISPNIFEDEWNLLKQQLDSCNDLSDLNDFKERMPRVRETFADMSDDVEYDSTTIQEYDEYDEYDHYLFNLFE